MANLRQVVSFRTREVEFLSEGWIQGGRVPARVRGLFVQDANVTFLRWRRAL